MKINYIPVSMLSSLIGRNPYKTKQHTLIEYLQVYNKDEWKKMKKHALYEEAYRDNIHVLQEHFDFKIKINLSYSENYNRLLRWPCIQKFLKSQETENIVIVDKPTQKDIEETVRTQLKTTKNYHEKINEIKPIVSKAKYSTVVEKVITLDRGTVLEDVTISSLNFITRRQVFVQRWFCFDELQGYLKKPSKWDYTISGYIDGMSKDDHIYEIKNRKNRFFVPQYDIDQLIVYIILYQENLSGSLVQQFEGEIKIGPVLSYEVAVEFWKDIKPLLDNTIKEINKLVNNDMQRTDLILKHLC